MKILFLLLIKFSGFRDGVVNVLDIRLPPEECEIMKFHDFRSTILGSAITPDNQGIIVGAADGDFRVWEPRMYQEPVVEFNVFKDTFASPPPTMRFTSIQKQKTFHSVYALDIQSYGQLISCATSDGFVRLFDVCGKKCLAHTRYGPESTKVGPSSVRFHSHKVIIGFGNEKSVCAFGAPNF
uniref:WD_REPEATS_REGION domain-containing protein n=1 Tax=Bursaphelenchus xylophilus TaxID=6326 RepID=A0A1I7SMA5_BURXY